MPGKTITIAQQKGGSGKTTITVNLALALREKGLSVALLDTDPQGSLGRWFMMRRERTGGAPEVEFCTASAWGVSYECEKLRRQADVVLIDTPPKVDADLRPALREADLVIVPVAASLVDLWATEGVLDLAARERRRGLIVLNRMTAGTRLAAEVAEEAGRLAADVAKSVLAHRTVFAESLGQGSGVVEAQRTGAAAREIRRLADEVLARLG